MPVSKEKVRLQLIRAHEQENTLNKEMGKIDKQLRVLQLRKDKLARLVSKNVRYRNRMIKML
jgi:hypothetical protein